mmetsp:Transcript_17513/g.25742  ORF Transcript_17513/g.25742 Transcript_17513/m.25742 type:complete len:335 (+) Transcript_17513:448-1452(+)
MRHLGVEKLLSQHVCAVALVSGQPLLIGIVGLDEALVHNLARNRPVHGVVHDRAVPCCEHLQLVLPHAHLLQLHLLPHLERCGARLRSSGLFSSRSSLLRALILITFILIPLRPRIPRHTLKLDACPSEALLGAGCILHLGEDSLQFLIGSLLLRRRRRSFVLRSLVHVGVLPEPGANIYTRIQHILAIVIVIVLINRIKSVVVLALIDSLGPHVPRETADLMVLWPHVDVDTVGLQADGGGGSCVGVVASCQHHALHGVQAPGGQLLTHCDLLLRSLRQRRALEHERARELLLADGIHARDKHGCAGLLLGKHGETNTHQRQPTHKIHSRGCP